MSVNDGKFHPFDIINNLFSGIKIFTIIENKKEYARQIKTVSISLPEINCDVNYNFED